MMALRNWFQWMKLRSGVTTSVVVLAATSFSPSHASAVVLTYPDTTANNGQISGIQTNAPYANVGVRGSGQATVVYLGNDWALTAAHVTVHAIGSTINDSPYGTYTGPLHADEHLHRSRQRTYAAGRQLRLAQWSADYRRSNGAAVQRPH